MRKRLLTRVTSGVLATLTAGVLLTGCAGNAQTAAPEASKVDPFAPEVTDVRIAAFRNSNGVPVAVAAEELAKDYGITLTIVPAENSQIGLTQAISGDVAAAGTSYFGFIDAVQQGLPLKVIADSYVSTPGTQKLVALPSSGITELKDLIGKRVNVVSLNSSHAIKLHNAMVDEGLDPEKVEWVELPYGQVPDALAQGTVDASSAAGPALVAASGLGAKPIFDYGGEPFRGMSEFGYVTSTQFAQKNPNTVAALQCTLFAGQKAVMSDRKVYEKYLQSFVGASAELAATDPMLDFVTTNDFDSLNRNTEVYTEAGRLAEPFDFADHSIPLPDSCER